MKLLNYPLMDDDGDDDEEFQSDVENLDGSAPLPSSSSMGYSDRKDFARGAPISSSSMSTRRDTMSNRADAEDSDESSLEDWAGGFRTEHRRSASSSGFGNESKIRKRQRWSGVQHHVSQFTPIASLHSCHYLLSPIAGRATHPAGGRNADAGGREIAQIDEGDVNSSPPNGTA